MERPGTGPALSLMSGSSDKVAMRLVVPVRLEGPGFGHEVHQFGRCAGPMSGDNIPCAVRRPAGSYSSIRRCLPFALCPWKGPHTGFASRGST